MVKLEALVHQAALLEPLVLFLFIHHQLTHQLLVELYAEALVGLVEGLWELREELLETGYVTTAFRGDARASP